MESCSTEAVSGETVKECFFVCDSRELSMVVGDDNRLELKSSVMATAAMMARGSSFENFSLVDDTGDEETKPDWLSWCWFCFKACSFVCFVIGLCDGSRFSGDTLGGAIVVLAVVSSLLSSQPSGALL